MMNDKNEYAAPPDVWPEKGSSGSGTIVGYSVQARLAYDRAEQIGPYTLDTRWQTVDFPKTFGNGIIERAGSNYDAASYGLHTWEAAQALRYWFIADLSLVHKTFCLETRIVEHKIEFSFSVEAVAATEPLDYRGGEPRFPSRATVAEPTP